MSKTVTMKNKILFNSACAQLKKQYPELAFYLEDNYGCSPGGFKFCIKRILGDEIYMAGGFFTREVKRKDIIFYGKKLATDLLEYSKKQER